MAGVSRANWRGRQSWKARKGGDKATAAAERGYRMGYRSGLEKLNAAHLEKHGQTIRFEDDNYIIPYVVPQTRRKYHCDFVLDNGIIVETKGLFEPQDRAKHLLIKLQYPDLDIRFVFQRPTDRIYKGSPTTYAMWAEKYGFQWAAKLVPKSWMEEAGPARKPLEVLAAGPVA